MATSSEPLAKPITKKIGLISQRLGQKAIMATKKQNKKPENWVMRLLPSWVVIQPESGMAMTAPNDKINKSVPSRVLLMPTNR